jgi:hypothetical protein
VQAELVDRRCGQVALRALGQHGQPGRDVVPGLEGRQRLALAPTPAIAGPDSEDAAVLDEEPGRRRLREDDRPGSLGLLRQEPPQLGDRDDQVAVIPHRRRRRDPERAPAR